jgi:predicted methyltransferase
MRKITTFAFAFTLAAASAGLSAAPAPKIAAAVANTAARSADNVKLDESRKPAEVLSFFGIRPGMQVLDLFGANKYWAEITAPTVGPKGHVDVWEAAQFLDADGRKAFDEFTARQKNVSLIVTPMESPKFPRKDYDFVLLSLNYHDLYWTSEKFKVPRMDPAVWLKTVNGAMKRGGIVGVIDHVANPNNDTRATVDKLHRIDPNVLKADFQKAGFQLVGTSAILRNKADDHSLLVFDPKIRGKTDRVVYKFRKVR